MVYQGQEVQTEEELCYQGQEVQTEEELWERCLSSTWSVRKSPPVTDPTCISMHLRGS
jgi:hypothetical protein